MRLKLDENLNERGRALLVAAGHEVATVALQGLQGTLDVALIEICRREGRALVTLDLDFANPLRFQPADYPGFAVLRLPKRATAQDLLQTIETLARALGQNPLGGHLWIVEKGRLRVSIRTGGATSSPRVHCGRWNRSRISKPRSRQAAATAS